MLCSTAEFVCVRLPTLVWTSDGETEEFVSHFRLLFWATYRRGMPALGPAGLTSDAGWGCMVRSAQMLVAHALQRSLLSEGAHAERALLSGVPRMCRPLWCGVC